MPSQLFKISDPEKEPTAPTVTPSPSLQSLPATVGLKRRSPFLEALDLASAPSQKCCCPCSCGGCTCPCRCGGQKSSSTTEPVSSGSEVSFVNIPVPEVNVAKVRKTNSVTKVPKAATGKEFLAICTEKIKRKEEEKVAKEERKREREEKKRKAEEANEEKKRKLEERREGKERSAALKEQKRKAKEAKKKEMQELQRMLESDSDCDISTIDPNKCHSCGGPFKDEEANQWIGCNRCPRWLHRRCVKGVDLLSMTEEEIEEYHFECVYC